MEDDKAGGRPNQDEAQQHTGHRSAVGFQHEGAFIGTRDHPAFRHCIPSATLPHAIGIDEVFGQSLINLTWNRSPTYQSHGKSEGATHTIEPRLRPGTGPLVHC